MAVDQDLDGQDDDVAVRFLICEIDVATTLCVLSFAIRLTPGLSSRKASTRRA